MNKTYWRNIYNNKMSSVSDNLAAIPFLLTRFVYVAVVIWVLSAIGLAAGVLYLSLITLSTILLFWAFFWFKEEEFIKTLLPFETNVDKLIFGFTIGLGLPLLLTLFGFLFKISGIFAKNFYTAFVGLSFAPLVSFGGTPGVLETFSVVKAQNNPLLTWFVVVLGASTLEEIVTGFAFVIIGGFFIAGLVGIISHIFGIKISRKAMQKWFFWGGIAGSVLFFAGIHAFNSTYVNSPGLFLFAAIFRGFMNFVIYKTKGLGIMFAIGAHQMNNLLSLGVEATLDAIITPLGALLIVIDLILVLGFFIRFNYMKPYFPQIFQLKKTV